jgi:two-component sensor histidine kinase
MGDIAWTIEPGAEGDSLVLTWLERGGPPATPPKKQGFGLRMISEGMPRSFGGEAELAFEPSGLRLVVRAPMSPAVVAA